MKTLLFACLLGMATLALAACDARQSLLLPTPIATFIAREAYIQPTPLQVDANLLTFPDITLLRDGSADAKVRCVTDAGIMRVEAAVNASVFARCSLLLVPEKPAVTGNEILQIHGRCDADVKPNLYLVDSTEARVPVRLGAYGLDESWQTVHIPLREVRSRDGRTPQMDDLRKLELVFEWEDMAGAVELDDLRFASTWVEPVSVSGVATAQAEGLHAPDGFVVDAIAEDLLAMTQIDFTPAGDMLVSLQGGRIWWYTDTDANGAYDQRHLYDSGYAEIVGLLYDPVDGAVWVGGRGRLYRTLDSDGDGVADIRELRLDDLPWGRHQNNGLAWNPATDPFSGEPANSWIYFGLGSTGDLEVGEEISATVLRFPRAGRSADELQIVSKGHRNAYMVAWGSVPVDLSDPNGATAWQLFASENGPDFNDAPDEVNHIRWQHHYGFPAQFGPVAADVTDDDPFSGPVYPVTTHASASGLAFINNPTWPAAYRTLYVSLFGQVFSEETVGHTVERISLQTEEIATGVTYRGTPSNFVTGLDRPLPMATGPDGNLVMGDYATGIIYRVRYTGE